MISISLETEDSGKSGSVVIFTFAGSVIDLNSDVFG